MAKTTPPKGAGKGGEASNNAVLPVPAQPGEPTAKALARTALRPTVRAAISIRAYSYKFGDLELASLIDDLGAQVQAVNGGDLKRAEAMLVSQAHTLDALFNHMVLRAKDQTALPQLEAFMRYALRAQSQARATLETLAAIKNPPIVYARQANIAQQQQVNNGVPVAPPRARETENNPNEQSGSSHELLPDAGTSALACGVDPTVATLGEIDRAEVRRG